MKKIGTFVPKNEILDKNVFYKYETEEQRKIKFENEKNRILSRLMINLISL